MESIGTLLKNQREARKLSLEEASKATKIRVERLEEMEKDNFTNIPGVGYQREFVRTYAKYLRLDPHKMVRDFNRQLGLTENEFSFMGEEAVIAPDMHTVRAVKFKPVSLGILVAVFSLLCVGGYYYVKLVRIGMAPRPTLTLSRPEPVRNPVPPAPQPVKPVGVKPVPVAVTNAVVVPPTNVAAVVLTNLPPTVSSNATHVLKIRANDECWVRVVVDGIEDENDAGTVLEAGEEKTWQGVLFRAKVFNPSLVTLTFNGREVPGFNDGAEPKEVTLP
ncbi:MAG: DUF4115 domain-containing protein [Verrucomicrobiae bacterium]|nr:DUF4115 domain-containing protein [Verrucomicrobiae bacterium]